MILIERFHRHIQVHHVEVEDYYTFGSVVESHHRTRLNTHQNRTNQNNHHLLFINKIKIDTLHLKSEIDWFNLKSQVLASIYQFLTFCLSKLNKTCCFYYCNLFKFFNLDMASDYNHDFLSNPLRNLFHHAEVEGWCMIEFSLLFLIHMMWSMLWIGSTHWRHHQLEQNKEYKTIKINTSSIIVTKRSWKVVCWRWINRKCMKLNNEVLGIYKYQTFTSSHTIFPVPF